MCLDNHKTMACSLTFFATLCAACNGFAFATSDVMLDEICLAQRAVVNQFPTMVSSPFGFQSAGRMLRSSNSPDFSNTVSSPFSSNTVNSPYSSNTVSTPFSSNTVGELQAASVMPLNQAVPPFANNPYRPLPAPRLTPEVGGPPSLPPLAPVAPLPSLPPSWEEVGSFDPLNPSLLPCTQKLQEAQDQLAIKTQALTAKKIETEEMEKELKSYQSVINSSPSPSRDLQNSIDNIEKEIKQNEVDREIATSEMKKNSQQFEEFKPQFLNSMRKELQEFKKNAEEKIQALDDVLQGMKRAPRKVEGP